MKKFLSLVLALVMTMSLVTVGAGAADFTDDSSITYKEAVDVMTALGVVGGYSDGSFGPKGTLTRGAAAKIICNLILGSTTADALVADSAPYSDVPTTNVFAGYIAYLAKTGIVGGYADGTFRPGNVLTGYAFMKMLLGVIGLDADVEGYNEGNWSIAVAKRALSETVDLTDGLVGNFDGTKTVTREEACLYAFNAIKAVPFKYDTKSTIVVGNVSVSSTSEATQTNNGDPDSEDEAYKYSYYQNVFSKLEYDEDGVTDSFKRPAHTWTYKDDEVGTYTDTADYVIVLDKNYEAEDFEEREDVEDELQDLTGNNKLNYNGSTELYVNGDEADLSDAYACKGTVVELFCDDNYIETAVVIVTTLAKIDDVDDELGTVDTKAGATYAIELVDFDGEAIGTYYDDYKNDEEILVGFDAKTYTEDTYIAVVLNSEDEVLDSYVAETVEGEVSSFKADTYVYVNGTKYTFSGVVEGTTDNFSFDSDYVLYLDVNGYVLGVDGVSAADLSDVYYVTGVYLTKSAKGTTKYYAETVSLTGEVADYQLETSEIDDAWDLEENGDFCADMAGLYKLTDKKTDDCKGNNGKYNMDAWTGNADYDLYVGEVDDDVKASDSKMYVDGDKVYLEKKTQFVAVEDHGDDLDVTTAVGGMKIAADDEATVYVITEDGETDAKYVLIASDDLSGAVASDDMVYVAEQPDEANNDGWVATLYFMADNSSKSVTVAENYEEGFYTYSIDDDGIYKLEQNEDGDDGEIDEDVDDDVSGWLMKITFNSDDIHNDDLTAGSYLEDVNFADAKVIDVRSSSEKKDDAYTKAITSVASLKAAAKKGDVTVDLYVNDGEITFICVTAVD